MHTQDFQGPSSFVVESQQFHRHAAHYTTQCHPHGVSVEPNASCVFGEEAFFNGTLEERMTMYQIG
jgi:hypothetical protein